METIYKMFLQSIMITGFVFIMMLVIEYINVQSKGVWQKHLTGNKWKQYLIAGFLGAIPGCLGAFTVVALFTHRLVSFGALVTTMIATSGDEAFVMFALFPEKAMLLTVIIFVVGVLAGYLWVFGILLLMHFLMMYIDVESWISNNMFVVLLLAILIGIIPESGPHLIFVTLFASGTVPFSILLASSISQDGHGMLPMLAESKKGFVAVKVVNMIFAFIVGAIGLLLRL